LCVCLCMSVCVHTWGSKFPAVLVKLLVIVELSETWKVMLGNNRKISNIEILIFISYCEINPLYYRHGCNSTK